MNGLPMSIYWPVATKASDLKPNAAHPDRLTVNGVSYGLTPAMAEGLFSCYQNLKRKAGRPKGSAAKPQALILGDNDLIWAVSPAEGERLAKAGYEYAE